MLLSISTVFHCIDESKSVRIVIISLAYICISKINNNIKHAFFVLRQDTKVYSIEILRNFCLYSHMSYNLHTLLQTCIFFALLCLLVFFETFFQLNFSIFYFSLHSCLRLSNLKSVTFFLLFLQFSLGCCVFYAFLVSASRWKSYCICF